MKNRGDGPAFILQTYEDRLNNNNNNNNNNKSSEIEKLSSPPVAKLNKLNRAISGPAPPPPPPPLPQLNGNSPSSQQSSPSASVTQQNSKNTVNKPKPPTVPVKYSVLSYNNNNNRAKSPSISSSSSSATTFNEYHPTPQNPPPCPSPDYDSLSLASSTTSTRSSAILSSKRNDSAEMESLDSYQMNNPSNVTPKPPSTYFKKRTLTNSLSNQSDTTTRTRPVSITIGEYPSMRRQPGKLNFLRSMNDQFDGTEKKSSTIGNQLTNELIQTLNRSNLRKKTESMEDLLSANYSLARIKTQRNGSVQISLNKSNLAKSTNDLTDDASADDNYDTIQRKNRVTINVNSNLQIVENNSSPSGILKNGHECNHKIISAQKSITFGEMPTLTKPKMSFKT